METVNQENAVVNTEGQQIEENNATFTQDDVDRIVKERLERERSKFADYETLKEKAIKFDEAEEASKSELQKATEKVDSLQKELDSIKSAEAARLVREEVSKATGVPAHLLTGGTKEECEAQAKDIMAFAKPGMLPNVPDSGEVRHTGAKGEARDQFADWVKQNFTTGGN